MCHLKKIMCCFFQFSYKTWVGRENKISIKSFSKTLKFYKTTYSTLIIHMFLHMPHHAHVSQKRKTLILYTCFAPAISQDSQPKKEKLEKNYNLHLVC
jgi:hypothetical protein